jgi:SulP family sulfate permease
LVAGLSNALVYIPQGIAYALVAGVNPVFGLYTGIIAPVVGALTAGSSFLVIIATNELAIPTGAILSQITDGDKVTLLCTLTLLVGLFQLGLGLLKLGRLTRFISESVMTGFITGVAVLLILGQLFNLTGYRSGVSGNILVKTWYWVTHLGQTDPATVAVGLLTIIAILLFQRTRMKPMAFILSVILASIAAALLKSPSIALLGSMAEISGVFPAPILPDINLLP